MSDTPKSFEEWCKTDDAACLIPAFDSRDAKKLNDLGLAIWEAAQNAPPGEHGEEDEPPQAAPVWQARAATPEAAGRGDGPLENQVRRLTEALAMMYDKWENGTSCQEADEDGECIDGTYLGNAFKLSQAEEQEVLNLIVTTAESHEQACANCGKPYRAHLLHDHNKCSPNSDAGWFPSKLADALRKVPSPPSGEQAQPGASPVTEPGGDDDNDATEWSVALSYDDTSDD
jgi:hypothetical protein